MSMPIRRAPRSSIRPLASCGRSSWPSSRCAWWSFWADCLGRSAPSLKPGRRGSGVARASHQAGIEVKVAAPGMIPRRPGDRVKTDKRDAERLARLLAAGELSIARVPSLDQEWLRDLVRAREDIRGDLMRARHRLSKFLLRCGLRWGEPAGTLTQAHHRWLAAQRFEDPASQAPSVTIWPPNGRSSSDARISSSAWTSSFPPARWRGRSRDCVAS